MSLANSLENGCICVQASSNAERVRNILTNLGDGFLRDEDHIARANHYIFFHALAAENILELQFFRLNPTPLTAVIEKDLGFGGGGETAGHGDGLRSRHFVPQVILARFAYLSEDDEIGFLEVHEIDIDNWVMQNFCVSRFDDFCSLGHSQAEHQDGFGTDKREI